MSNSTEKSAAAYGEMRKAQRERRERLFRKSRPYIRPFEIDKDMWALWAAYDLGSFPNLPAKLNPSDFTKLVRGFSANHSSCLVIDDDCKWFKSGRGPICFICVDNYGWRVEPYADFFKWATPRMILRATVAFMQKTRHSAAVGVCVVRAGEKSVNLLNHVGEYGVLSKCGKVPAGRPDGDEYLFYVRGKNAGTDGTRQHGEVQRRAGNQRPETPSPRREVEHPRPAVERVERWDEVAVAERPNDRHDSQRASPVAAAPADAETDAITAARAVKIRDWS